MKFIYIIIPLAVALLLGGEKLFRRFLHPGSALLFITTAFLLLGGGFILGPQGSGILSASALNHLEPLVVVITGWVGLVLGLQLKINDLAKVPRAIFLATFLQALITLLLVVGSLFLLRQWLPEKAAAPRFIWMLGALALASAPEVIQILGVGTKARPHHYHFTLLAANFDRILAVLLMGVLYGVFHRDSVSQGLLWLHWLGLTLLLGSVLGILGGLFVRYAAGSQEFLAISTGLLIFASGAAFLLRLSPLLLTMLMGLVIINATRRGERWLRTLVPYDQPLFLLLIILGGVMLTPPERSWGVLLVIYLLTRGISRILGSYATKFLSSHRERLLQGTWMLPQGGVTLALGINQLQFFGDGVARQLYDISVAGVAFFALIFLFLQRDKRKKNS